MKYEGFKKPKKTRKAVRRFWRAFFVKDGFCTLCGNTGFIDTTGTAKTPIGQMVGRRNICICPNGETIRFYPA